MLFHIYAGDVCIGDVDADSSDNALTIYALRTGMGIEGLTPIPQSYPGPPYQGLESCVRHKPVFDAIVNSNKTVLDRIEQILTGRHRSQHPTRDAILMPDTVVLDFGGVTKAIERDDSKAAHAELDRLDAMLARHCK